MYSRRTKRPRLLLLPPFLPPLLLPPVLLLLLLAEVAEAELVESEPPLAAALLGVEPALLVELPLPLAVLVPLSLTVNLLQSSCAPR